MATSQVFSWSEVESDSPIPHLHRKRVYGEKMLVANVFLDKGCDVQGHRHEGEQMACVISGKVRFHLGEPHTDDYRTVEVSGGQIVFLPSNFWHAVYALEDTHIIDILSPISEMGVDSQGS